MSKPYLVIVESPGKIKKLKAILGADYEIIASMGHVVDLPRTSFGIHLDTMQPEYEVVKADVAKRLRSEAQKPYKIIYLASDPDREGEAISHHIATLLKRAKTSAQMQRVTFDAITPRAVKAAFASPRQIDPQLVAAQEARRLLDRLVGFPASRFLWQSVDGKGLSAGRVQSVALRLVVERDQAIATFVADEYWTISALFKTAKGEFSARLTEWQGQKPMLKNKESTEAILGALKGASYQIQSVMPKQRQQTPPAPFTTSSLQQAASSHLKFSPDITMTLAQQLYENGLITYMRTDSPAVSPEGIQMAQKTIESLYGSTYVGSNTYSAKGNAQEAHECVRPTDTEARPEAVRLSLGTEGSQAADLYELIYNRFLASQMANAVFNDVHIKVAGGAAIFSAKGSQMVFDGFQRLYTLSEEQEQGQRADDDSDDPDSQAFPPLTTGEAAQTLKLTPIQHFTKPPAAYTEALLVKALEQHGVGRPSTYAQTLATIKERGYVEVVSRKLTATSLGKQVHTVLDRQLKGLFETPFTAQMETALDEIAAGKQPERAYLRSLWAQISPLFGATVIQATLGQKSDTTANAKNTHASRKTAASSKSAVSSKSPEVHEEGLCPQCQKPLVRRKSAHGEFLGCSGFPACRFTARCPASPDTDL